MASISKVIMVATVVMVISLAVIIALVLLLLADLYCSLLLTRRRQRRLSNSATRLSVSPSPPLPPQPLPSPPQPLRTLYAQGVLRAPRSLLFPSVLAAGSDLENQHFQLLHFLKPSDKTTPPSATSRPIQDDDGAAAPVSRFNEDEGRESSSGGSDTSNDLVYISNPMYDNDTCRTGPPAPGGTVDTPFETPETSPSNLGHLSGDEESHNTPPLTPMKVPEKACSISMKDGRFLASSGSESNSKNDLSSSSSTGSPCTSPSW